MEDDEGWRTGRVRGYSWSYGVGVVVVVVRSPGHAATGGIAPGKAIRLCLGEGVEQRRLSIALPAPTEREYRR